MIKSAKHISFFKNSTRILLVLFLVINVNAQEEIKFRRLSPEGGFTDKAVKKILQDQMGYIWVATNYDLFKYNSYNFSKVSFLEQYKKQVSHVVINDLIIDNAQNIWVGTTQKLYRYNYHSDKFEELILNVNSKDGELKSITSGKDSLIFIAYENSLYTYNIYSDHISTINTPHSNIHSAYETSNGTIILACLNSGIYKSTAGNIFKPVTDTIKDDIVASFFTDSIIYIAYKNKGVFNFSIDGSSIDKMRLDEGQLSHKKINSLFYDSRGKLWIGTYNGLDILYPDGKIKHYKHLDANANSLPSNSVHCFYEDSQGSFWIGTWSGGLSYYNKYENFFKHIKHQVGINSITDNYINCFMEDVHNNLWIGTERGSLNKYNRSTRQFEHIRLNPSSEQMANIKTMHKAKNGKLYVGTFLNGLFSIDKYDNISKIDIGYEKERIYALEEDESGLWIGDFGHGLSYFNYRQNRTTKYYGISDGSSNLSSSHITSLLVDDGDLWVGTNDGLFLKKRGEHTFLRYHYINDTSGSISSNIITCIKKHPNGEIWVGTRSGGLNKYIRAQNKFINYSLENGLAGVDAIALLFDNNGNIWISGENGISKLNPENGNILNYNSSDGLQGNQFNRNAAYKSTDGKLYFGGTNGYSIIDPAILKYNPIEPRPILTQIKINNEIITPATPNSPLEKNISETSEITLNYQQSSISLNFIANNYLNPAKNLYRYRLVGLKDNWETTNLNSVTYNNLNPGKYIFELFASNNDGLWSKRPVQLNVVIRPPWWLSKIAFPIYILLIISAIWLIHSVVVSTHRLRLENVKRENDEKINDLKLQFFTNISHEFKTPLTLILSPLQRIIQNSKLDEESKSELELAEKNAFRLKKLVNQFIELRRIDQAKLNLYISKIEIVSFVEDIFSCFRELAENKHIDFDFDQQIEPTDIYVDAEKVDKIIINILSNAFKYTPNEGQIKVILKKDPVHFPKDWNIFTLGESIRGESVKIIITDSGKGISEHDLPNIFERFYRIDEEEELGSGIGLSLTKEYILLHKFSLTVASSPYQGSVFVIRLPEKDEALLNESHVKLINESVKPTTKDLREKMSAAISIESNTNDKNQKQKNLPLLLLVEDNDELRDYLIKILEIEYRVIFAVNGEEGFKKTTQFYPEIIISDIMMKDGDGLEFCKKVKTDLLTSHIPFILLTALAEDQNKIEGLEHGADAYISKPFDIQLLQSQIKNLLEGRKRLRIATLDNGQQINKKEVLSSLDTALLKKAKKYVEDHITNREISTNDLADVLAMSRTNLHRKLKSLTGQSATQFIKTIRLTYAVNLIENGNDSIEEVSFASGFNSTSYFSKCFKEVYKMSPREYKNIIYINR